MICAVLVDGDEWLATMCNSYRFTPRRSQLALEIRVSEEAEKLPSDLIRRTGPGVVVRYENGDLVAEVMRWGFQRPFSKAINNTRSDNLGSPIWQEALAERRCLVPMSKFYEWHHDPRGGKHAYEFYRPDGNWLWVAGIYERSPELGACYSTITTEPVGIVATIHDRMLAVMEFENAIGFLENVPSEFASYSGELIANACDSPLKKAKPPGGNVQGELF